MEQPLPPDGYAIALRAEVGPARKRFRSVTRYVDLAEPTGGLLVEVHDQVDPQGASDELWVRAPLLATNQNVTGDTISVYREPGCPPGRALALALFTSDRLACWGLPRADCVLADRAGLALAKAGPLSDALTATPEMRTRLLCLLVINGIEPPPEMVEAVASDCAADARSHVYDRQPRRTRLA
jgi:hypothetical protein